MRSARTHAAFASAAAAVFKRCRRGSLELPTRRCCTTRRPRPPACTLTDQNAAASMRGRDTAASSAAYASWKIDEAAANDTIFALSSGGAGAVSGVAVIRVSGPDAHRAVSALLAPGASLPKPRRAGVRKLVDPTTGLPLDEALVLVFRAPGSFTGEDVAELHVHGSRAVVRATLAALAGQGGRVRPASRGEFSRRAFENGRLDLTAAEGLADLLAAETETQRVQALRAAGGEARRVLEGWRADAKRCLAHAEAVIDFGDDVDDGAFQDVVPRARALQRAIEARLERDGRAGEIVRDGVKVAIVGPPNVGKSSLLNAIARRDVAIVADVPGTTRDVLAVAVDLDGVAVTLADTAGIRAAPVDRVEAEGIRRARAAADDADITIVMRDARDVVAGASDADGIEGAGEEACIRVANKMDLLDGRARGRVPATVLGLSLIDEAGPSAVDAVVSALTDAVRRHVRSDGAAGAEMPVVTRARHRYHLGRAVTALAAFADGRSGASRAWLPMDIAAEELRIACRELGAITGVVHVEEVLDVIFRDFCIGK